MTLKEIATEAGVSISTVSRVINKKGPHVASPEVQDRIWEIVSKTGYVPNENAVNLKRRSNPSVTDRSKSIACLFARTAESINDPFFSQLARSVEAEAFKQGYYVQYSLTEFDVKRPEMIHTILSEKIKGVVILGRCDKTLLSVLKNYFKYVSYTGLNELDAKYDQVICNGEEASAEAVRFLYNQGHRNIAYIGEKKNECRYKGYVRTLEELGIPYNEDYVADVQLSSENGYHGALSLMKNAEGVTAILCANDLTAIGAMRALRELDIKIPKDMSVIGIDDIDMAQYMTTKLTTVHMPVEEMGQMATKILIDRIEAGHKLHMKLSLPFYIVERESCGKPPKQPWRNEGIK